MFIKGGQQPQPEKSKNPPRKNWDAAKRERFFDLKLSHLVEIILTLALVFFGYLQWRIYSRQAAIMATQAEISREQLNVSIIQERPWIRVDIAPLALKFDPKSGDASLSYQATIKNVGNTVAIGVHVEAKVFIPPSDNNIFAAPSAQQAAYCAQRIANRAIGTEDQRNEGVTLFPGESFPTAAGEPSAGSIGLSKSDMVAAAIPFEEHDKEFFAPFLIGCAHYRFSGALDHHQTGFIYEIQRYEPTKDPNHPLALQIGAGLGPPNLIFTKWFFGSGVTN